MAENIKIECLKPCPFCGRMPSVYMDDLIEEWFVECARTEDECPVMVLGGPYPTHEEAVIKWNTRVEV